MEKPSKNDIFDLGRKLQVAAAKEKDDRISVAMARLGDAIEDWGTPFGPKNMKDLEKKTGLTANSIALLIKKVKGNPVVRESFVISEEVSEAGIQQIANKISSYGLATKVRKSNLGSSPSYFLYALSPKNTWINGISDNAPLYFLYHIHNTRNGDYTVEVTRFGHKAKEFGLKPPRAFKTNDIKVIETKILDYFKKNADIIKKVATIKESISEAASYKINHKTFSDAIQHAVSVAEKQGYQVDSEDYDNKVAVGPKKPSSGNTNKYILKLLKDGKETRRTLHVQIYNADNKYYELNAYVD